MSIDEIRDKLSIAIADDSEAWLSSLDETEPGHYGVEDWEVLITKDDIWVEVQERSFTFKNARFNFALRIGSSNDEDGYVESFKRVVSGSGTFEFAANGKDITVTDLDLEYDLSLFE